MPETLPAAAPDAARADVAKLLRLRILWRRAQRSIESVADLLAMARSEHTR